MKIFLFLILGLISQVSYTQCDDSRLFTEVEKESFVKVYLSIKKEKPESQEKLLYDLAVEHKITPEQFQQIQHPNQDNRQLTDEESAFVSEVHQLQQKYNSQLKKVERKICKNYNLEQFDFESMQHQYLSCMRFQRSLSDYFNKWMK